MGNINVTAWLVSAILASAVAGSLFASALAIHGADAELPAQYHWEGAEFERDVVLARRAVDLEVAASLRVFIEKGVCRVQLNLDAPPPAALSLAWVHSTDARLDRTITLKPGREGYEGACPGLVVAHYHVELADRPHTWSIRQEVTDPRQAIELVAPHPPGR